MIGIAWFAYTDNEEGVSKAVCFELGITVRKPTLQEAIADVLRMAKEHLEGPEKQHRYFAGDWRWMENMNSFAEQCSNHPDGRNQVWDCGTIK